jgi:hypothetical protein
MEKGRRSAAAYSLLRRPLSIRACFTYPSTEDAKALAGPAVIHTRAELRDRVAGWPGEPFS